MVTSMDLSKFAVEADGLVISIQWFGESRDLGLGPDFRELCEESSKDNPGW